MRKAARLFEIVQILRLARQPVTAAAIAERMEVAPRSIYRDIAALQGMRVPIEGGRGIGYVLRPGFTLPPLMFTIEETEAVVLALALLQRTSDGALRKAADEVASKIAGAVPAPLRDTLDAATLHAWGAVPAEPAGVELGTVRHAIRDERKIRIRYGDEAGRETERTIWPIALIYYPETTNIVAWCELREALRHFRADRIRASEGLEDRFVGQGDAKRRAWVAGWRIDRPVDRTAPER